MILDFNSIVIALIIIIGFVVIPKKPGPLLLFFIFIVNIISWWHIYDFPVEDAYFMMLPEYFAKKSSSNINRFDIDLFILTFLFVLVILLSNI